LGDAVETDVALGEDGRCLLRGCSGGGHCGCVGASDGARTNQREVKTVGKTMTTEIARWV
jgi:hypothetical protein